MDLLFYDMPRQAIEQATCESCDNEDAAFSVNSSTILKDHDAIVYDVRCTCHETATIAIDPDGTHAGRGVNHDGASWNEEDSNDE